MGVSGLGRRAALLGGLASLAAATAPRGGAIPIEFSNGSCLVPVVLDGRAARMVLDTGAAMSVVTSAAVARLGLRSDPWVSTTLRGAGGRVERRANIDVRSARAGLATLFQRVPGSGLSLPVTSSDLGGADGLLGGDILRHYNLDLDIPRARLVLDAASLPPPGSGAVRLQLLRRDLLLAPVLLDGHALLALVDTGSSVSLINARGSYRFGLTSVRTQRDPAVVVHGLGGLSTARMHRFAELRLGSLIVTAPTLLIETVAESAYDLTLGLDVLARQRLHLSYSALVATQ